MISAEVTLVVNVQGREQHLSTRVLPIEGFYMPGSAHRLHFMDELIGSGAKCFHWKCQMSGGENKKGYWSNVPSKVTGLRGSECRLGELLSSYRHSYF